MSESGTPWLPASARSSTCGAKDFDPASPPTLADGIGRLTYWTRVTDELMREYAVATVAAEVWNVPTLTAFPKTA